ncbi:uncharacterized protein LOC120633258 isoform X1 [Pararge aegeria]|uniref:uncharacterized protein LOC120633258 isoform X1 n=1 Tax=Pararge aegeria TaxID=116150 RepID=UPI0019D29EF7|nr:uncharacterized protein LOC120633258 isoform X1 [Pararge aegeria]XP_039759360.1 uncharacterized protein LOC120633258 isoform X1 [Pararge aegeria]XP_039759361.1 uncharacterized protein LOC120633258 isoform X1 [Pararge aegeria]XP_039759362.1 uncharacterized protein LOC120633258 isoform X1 [Pararge aegeria]
MVPLVEIPRAKWPELRDLFRNGWPDGAVPFCFLDTQIAYPNLDEFCKVKVYSPDGDMTNGFVAVYNPSNTVEAYEVMIQPLQSIEKIEGALTDSKVIDWTRVLCVTSATPVVEECLRRREKQLGIHGNTEGNKAFKHFLDANSMPFELSSNPPDTYVAELKPEHLHIIDETWTFHSDRSYKFFESLLRNHLTYVLYSTKEDHPLAWVTISWEGALTHLYCIEKHRRKGYAAYIIKCAVNDQLKKGKHVLGYTLVKNVKAQNLFDKLNFRRIGYDTWIDISKE